MLINKFKIWAVFPGPKGTEIHDESGRNTVIVQETVEEIEKLTKE